MYLVHVSKHTMFVQLFVNLITMYFIELAKRYLNNDHEMKSKHIALFRFKTKEQTYWIRLKGPSFENDPNYRNPDF